ncbi:MAG: PASTA domain-containing protein [Treponema sp.]|nr:PASTA domain-containing protein [Treponema sp.]
MARKKITDENKVIEENAVIEENENVLQEEEKDSFTNSEIEVDDYNSEISVKTEEVTKDKTKKARKSLAESFNTFQNSIPVIIITFVVSLVIMGLACIGVFFANVKGEEQVLVPNVVGKKWDEALLEMQTKELYPRITLRYSDNPGDEGKILEQDPDAGSIVKGYSRVSLVISRGIVIDEVGDYVGKNLDDVRMSLQTLFAGQTKPLIILAEPEYKPDLSDPGTILEQDPPEGFRITEPVTVQLVVSRGPNYENTRRPYVVGQSINDLLQTIARSKIVFDISGHTATGNEKAGTVVSQQTIDEEFVPNYTRVTVEMALPNDSDDENISGIFQSKIALYPYPVPMRLEAVPEEGNSYTILNFNHPGGNVTIPYSVAKGTTLILYVVDKVTDRLVVD